jgi:nucleotide-binding universal stress UspA family protein
MKKILIATDGSPSALEAVDVGLEIAAEQGSDVTFVHVLPPDQFITARNAPSIVVPHEVSLDESETALREASEAAEEAGVSFAVERVSGETVPEIVAIAEAIEAELIVVGSRGRGPVTSALLGSVSRGVLGHAKTPVLIVRATPTPVPSA